MTNKDFNELAKQLAIVRQEIKNPLLNTTNYTWTQCVEAVILACRTTSANFNEQRFREACNK